MKGTIALVLALLALLGCALAEGEGSASAYANWLEAALPDADFADTQVPAFCTEMLGADYEFIARSDANYGTYVAGARRADAPAIPETALVESSGSFSPSGSTRRWTLRDGERVIYDFVLADGVELTAFDGCAHLIVTFFDADAAYGTPFQTTESRVLDAADAQRRARMAYQRERGFADRDESRPQLALWVHDIDTWRAGATDQPSEFYLDVDLPADLAGARSVEGEKARNAACVDIGARLLANGEDWTLVASTSGVRALRRYGPLRIVEAGPGYDALLDRAEAALGYRPGDMDFLGKESVRATFEWNAGSLQSEDGLQRWAAGSRAVEDAGSLRKLDALFNGADFTVGGVNCPSPAFLTMEYADGSAASFAVAINSFDLFFYRGVCFTTGADVIDLFQLRETDFFQAYYGG